MNTIIFQHWVTMANSAINGDTDAAGLIKNAHSDLLHEIKLETVNKKEYEAELIFLAILRDGISNIEKEA